uniref:RNA polymerase I associated factor, A49-like protein n=1 Tax=Acrobeloides nanus TaxID=290746 RepID=A0A914BXD9_9BILA
MEENDSRPSSSIASTSNSIFKTPKLPKLNNSDKAKEIQKPKDVIAIFTHNVIAIFTHSEIANPGKAKFVRHKNRSGGVVYSVKNSGTSNVRHVGMPLEQDDGYEYVVAKVSKVTRNPRELRPATLIKFEAVSNANEVIKGTVNTRAAPDYNADYSFSSENYAQKRRDLISQFGSAKKNKFQEAAIRRRITEDTLSAMTSTAFASPAELMESKSIIKTEDVKPGAAQQGSLILPKPNMLAQIPIDVYSLSLFRSNEDVERYGKTALAYFKQHDEEDKLLKADIPVFLVHRIGNVLNGAKPEERAFLALKLITMAKFIILLNANVRKKTINFDDLDAFKLPESFNLMIRTEFFSDRLQGKRFGVSTIDREKILAHFLCLALVYDPTSLELPITPICLELHTTEKKISGILEALGCMINQGSLADQERLKTLRIARLIGPPKEKIRNNRKRKSL